MPSGISGIGAQWVSQFCWGYFTNILWTHQKNIEKWRWWTCKVAVYVPRPWSKHQLSVFPCPFGDGCPPTNRVLHCKFLSGFSCPSSWLHDMIVPVRVKTVVYGNTNYDQCDLWMLNHLWLVVWNMTGLWLSIYWQCHNPNWRTPSFFRGVGQPPTSDQFHVLLRWHDGRQWTRFLPRIDTCFFRDQQSVFIQPCWDSIFWDARWKIGRQNC